jgi:hypothetical protein
MVGKYNVAYRSDSFRKWDRDGIIAIDTRLRIGQPINQGSNLRQPEEIYPLSKTTKPTLGPHAASNTKDSAKSPSGGKAALA